MAYTVPSVPLVAQDLSLACWYASASMLIAWRREATQSTERDRPAPSEVPEQVDRYKANHGLMLDQMIEFARLMGLSMLPPMSPTLDALETVLRQHGPIWTAGKKIANGNSYGHVVVIVGVRDRELFIHDPEPVGAGTRRWVPDTWLGTTLSLAPAVMPSNFMYYS